MRQSSQVITPGRVFRASGELTVSLDTTIVWRPGRPARIAASLQKYVLRSTYPPTQVLFRGLAHAPPDIFHRDTMPEIFSRR